MNETDKNNRNAVLIDYIKSIVSGYKVKAEYSTNDKDDNVIVVQQTSGNKVVFFDNDNPLFNYFNIYIYGDSIENEYKTAIQLGELIGKHEIIEFETNGGSNVSPVTVKDCSKIVNIPVPTKGGVYFGGWYTTAEFTSGTEITSIASGSHGAVVVYVKTVNSDNQKKIYIVYITKIEITF